MLAFVTEQLAQWKKDVQASDILTACPANQVPRPGVAPISAASSGSRACSPRVGWGPSIGPCGSVSRAASQSRNKCELTVCEPERVQPRVDVRGDGLLVLLDQADPGWQARVDGQDRSVATVAGLFRGVDVRTANREVEFAYRPLSVRLGAAVKLLGPLLVGLLVLRRPSAVR
ncbi:MAG: hypothetical protein HY814_13725 [Candidatus Riflebacteria bacterium]|nr:hypothetical protein [Candidatus Riflebacteria bacterium]